MLLLGCHNEGTSGQCLISISTTIARCKSDSLRKLGEDIQYNLYSWLGDQKGNGFDSLLERISCTHRRIKCILPHGEAGEEPLQYRPVWLDSLWSIHSEATAVRQCESVWPCSSTVCWISTWSAIFRKPRNIDIQLIYSKCLVWRGFLCIAWENR